MPEQLAFPDLRHAMKKKVTPRSVHGPSPRQRRAQWNFLSEW